VAPAERVRVSRRGSRAVGLMDGGIGAIGMERIAFHRVRG
jgi:hypothetical protein